MPPLPHFVRMGLPGNKSPYHKKKLELHILITAEIHMQDLSTKTLPLGLLGFLIMSIVCIIRSIN